MEWLIPIWTVRVRVYIVISNIVLWHRPPVHSPPAYPPSNCRNASHKTNRFLRVYLRFPNALLLVPPHPPCIPHPQTGLPITPLGLRYSALLSRPPFPPQVRPLNARSRGIPPPRPLLFQHQLRLRLLLDDEPNQRLRRPPWRPARPRVPPLPRPLHPAQVGARQRRRW